MGSENANGFIAARICVKRVHLMLKATTDNSKKANDHRQLEYFRKQAAEKLLYSKFYIVMAAAFAVGAFIIAIYIYNSLAGGYSINILRNPALLVMLFFPFVPSFFLAMLSKKRRAEAIEMLEPYYPTITAEDLRVLKDEI